MERINWRIVAAGGAVIALIIGVAVWRSGDDDTIVAGGATPSPEAVAETPQGDADPPAEQADDPSVDTPAEAAPDGESEAEQPAEEADPAPEDAEEPPSDDATEDTSADASEDAVTAGESTSAPNPNQDPAWDTRCMLYIHGAGTPPEALSDDQWEEDLLYLAPPSPNNEWPHFWFYDGPHNYEFDPDDSTEPYDNLVSYLTDYLDQNQCGPVMMHGASNGGGLAARIYCEGEDFGGRLWMAFIDDPVSDAGVIGCSPSAAVQRSLFVHSTELIEQAATFEENRCSRTAAEWPWYCQDDIGFDLEEYESHIGQESFLGREEHAGQNIDEYNFWTQATNWWATFDPDAYTQAVSG